MQQEVETRKIETVRDYLRLRYDLKKKMSTKHFEALQSLLAAQTGQFKASITYEPVTPTRTRIESVTLEAIFRKDLIGRYAAKTIPPLENVANSPIHELFSIDSLVARTVLPDSFTGFLGKLTLQIANAKPIPLSYTNPVIDQNRRFTVDDLWATRKALRETVADEIFKALRSTFKRPIELTITSELNDYPIVTLPFFRVEDDTPNCRVIANSIIQACILNRMGLHSKVRELVNFHKNKFDREVSETLTFVVSEYDVQTFSQYLDFYVDVKNSHPDLDLTAALGGNFRKFKGVVSDKGVTVTLSEITGNAIELNTLRAVSDLVKHPYLKKKVAAILSTGVHAKISIDSVVNKLKTSENLRNLEISSEHSFRRFMQHFVKTSFLHYLRASRSGDELDDASLLGIRLDLSTDSGAPKVSVNFRLRVGETRPRFKEILNGVSDVILGHLLNLPNELIEQRWGRIGFEKRNEKPNTQFTYSEKVSKEEKTQKAVDFHVHNFSDYLFFIDYVKKMLPDHVNALMPIIPGDKRFEASVVGDIVALNPHEGTLSVDALNRITDLEKHPFFKNRMAEVLKKGFKGYVALDAESSGVNTRLNFESEGASRKSLRDGLLQTIVIAFVQNRFTAADAEDHHIRVGVNLSTGKDYVRLHILLRPADFGESVIQEAVNALTDLHILYAIGMGKIQGKKFYETLTRISKATLEPFISSDVKRATLENLNEVTKIFQSVAREKRVHTFDAFRRVLPKFFRENHPKVETDNENSRKLGEAAGALLDNNVCISNIPVIRFSRLLKLTDLEALEVLNKLIANDSTEEHYEDARKVILNALKR